MRSFGWDNPSKAIRIARKIGNRRRNSKLETAVLISATAILRRVFKSLRSGSGYTYEVGRSKGTKISRSGFTCKKKLTRLRK